MNKNNETKNPDLFTSLERFSHEEVAELVLFTEEAKDPNDIMIHTAFKQRSLFETPDDVHEHRGYLKMVLYMYSMYLISGVLEYQHVKKAILGLKDVYSAFTDKLRIWCIMQIAKSGKLDENDDIYMSIVELLPLNDFMLFAEVMHQCFDLINVLVTERKLYNYNPHGMEVIKLALEQLLTTELTPEIQFQYQICIATINSM